MPLRFNGLCGYEKRSMKNLINFLMHYSTWFVFAFYVLVSLILLFSFNPFQGSVYLTSANAVTSTLNGATSEVTGYFSLRKINESLQASNADLENQVLNLKEEVKHLHTLIDDSVRYAGMPLRFDYVSASVINNSTRHPRNYFTINKGTADGVAPGMGVVDQSGVVGIVNVCGRRTSRVISVLTKDQHFSVKLKGTQFVGTLSWKENEPGTAWVEEIPLHSRFQIGDTVVTSGFSTTFPEGIPVGTVMGQVRNSDGNFFTLKIHLASDFNNLGIVRVIKDNLKMELDSLRTFDHKDE